MNSIKLKNKSIITLQNLFCTATLFAHGFAFASEKTPTTNDFFTAPLKQITTKNRCKNCIDFVEDANGKEFVLKYHENSESAIHETLGAQIGMGAEININNVKIFSFKKDSTDFIDRSPHNTKTLHTLVPGEIAYQAHLNSNKKQVYIKGGIAGYDNLEGIATHKDLAKIAALDIFLVNWDRHTGNFLFDEKNNHYHAIDMETIFPTAFSIPNNDNKSDYPIIMFSLSRLACDALPFHCIYEDLSPEKNQALKQVNKTLSKLMHNYPPQKLHDEWMNIAKDAGYNYSTSKQNGIRELIDYHFHETEQLQYVLTQVTKKTFLYRMAKFIARNPHLEESIWEL